VTIDGFTVQGQTNASNLGAAILLGAGTAGATVEDTIVQNNINGMWLVNDTPSNPTVIQRNLFRDNNQPGPAGGTAIYSDQFTAGGPVSGVTIDDNAFSGNNSAAVSLSSTSPTAVQSDVTISDNTFSANGNAVVASFLQNSALTRNAVSGGVGSDLVIQGGSTNVAVTENRLDGSGTAPRGLRVFDIGGSAPPASSITATCNSISGHATAGITVESGDYTGGLNAEFNWWGSASGPTNATTNPGGTGDALVDPDGNVDFRPFLTDGTDTAPGTPGFQCDNATAPTVSIQQAAGQADPTAVSPIHFTATFSEPVTDFGPGDVQLSGSANPSTATVTETTNGTVFDIAVSGMTGPGSVVATVPALAASDAGGDFNGASTSFDNTVNFQTQPSMTTAASGNVTLGGAISDSATLSGGTNPTGTIAFKIYGPDDTDCTGPSTLVASVPVTGNGTYESGPFTPTAAGTYRWVATYSGDASNAQVMGACNDPNESVTVVPPAPPDTDGDGRADGSDNCPAVANPEQADLDGDGLGDACDSDDDGDGVPDVVEQQRGSDPRAADSDGDGAGDGSDNCPVDSNADQADGDANGTGDACDRPSDALCLNLTARNGTAAGDRLRGTSAGELIRGLAGNDRIKGAGGNDCLLGGLGGDTISGGNGGDLILGEAGNDRLVGRAGKDRIVAGPGRNKLFGAAGRDDLDAVNGKRDRVNCGRGRDTARADRRDRVRRCERVTRA
jgi:Ca2+-binding RTX toxin-like protein